MLGILAVLFEAFDLPPTKIEENA